MLGNMDRVQFFPLLLLESCQLLSLIKKLHIAMNNFYVQV